MLTAESALFSRLFVISNVMSTLVTSVKRKRKLGTSIYGELCYFDRVDFGYVRYLYWPKQKDEFLVLMAEVIVHKHFSFAIKQ